MLISIITPVKNGASYLEETLESVLSQNYPFIEHVIVDGGSTDRTPEIVHQFDRRYPNKIKMVCGPDHGACDGLNRGWRIAKGDVLGWLGADDRFLPNAIRTVADFFKANPNKHFMYGGCEIINDKGDYIGRFATREFSLDTALNKGLYIPFPAAFYRRQVIETTGPVSIGHKACDSDFIIRASNYFKLHRIQSHLTQFRLHCNSISCTSGKNDFPKALFQMNREHGGRLLSPVCMRYVLSLLVKVPFFEYLCSLLTPWYFQPNRFSQFKTYAIFGASVSGYQCMNLILADRKLVHAFIDNYPPCNKSYCRRPVYTPSEFLAKAADRVDAVLIASSSSAFEMWRQLRRMGFKKPLKVYRFKNSQ